MKQTLALLLLPLLLALPSLAACSGSNVTTTGPDGSAPPSADGGATTSDTPHDGGVPSAEGGGATDAAGTPSGPDASIVELKNLSYSPSSTSNRVEITFALANHGTAAIDRVQEVTVQFSGDAVTFGISCQNPSWIVAAASSSNVITLDIDDFGSSADLTFSSSCNVSQSASTLPWGGSLNVEIKGLLRDATPWKASASATR